MKKHNYYSKNLDKAWFDSSNIAYAECDDKDNDLKTVRITFNNGIVYEYYDVNVNDYLLFRENASQGKAFNKYLRKYEFKKLEETKDISKLNEELEISQLLVNSFILNKNKNTIKCFVGEKEVGILDNLTNEEIQGIEKLTDMLHIKIFENDDN